MPCGITWWRFIKPRGTGPGLFVSRIPGTGGSWGMRTPPPLLEKAFVIAIVLADEFVYPVQVRSQRQGTMHHPRLLKHVGMFDRGLIDPRLQLGCSLWELTSFGVAGCGAKRSRGSLTGRDAPGT